MKGARGSVRVMVLMFSAMSVQKWLLRVGAVLIVIGFLLPRPVGPLPTVLGLVLILAPLFFGGGLLLRYFVAPRTLLLVPRAREQVLGGMALTVAIIALAVMLTSWRFGLPTEHLWIVGLWVVAATSIMLLTQFLVVTSVGQMTLWFVTLGAIVQSLQSPTARALIGTIAQNEWLLAGIIAASWSIFSFWFLRARAFKSPNDVAPSGTRTLKVSASHTAAIRAFLFGHPSLRYQFAGGFVLALVVGGIWTMTAAGKGTSVHSAADAVAKFAGPALGMGAYAGIGGFMVARRSKYLWLRGGVDRAGLFRLCELQAWGFFGATVASQIVLLAIACAALPSVALGYAVLLLFHLCAGTCLLYLGLMHVRGWPALDVLCALALSVVWVTAFATMTLITKQPWLAPILVAAMSGVAISFRLIALHRWRRIDWLVCRPPKLTPRAVPVRG